MMRRKADIMNIDRNDRILSISLLIVFVSLYLTNYLNELLVSYTFDYASIAAALKVITVLGTLISIKAIVERLTIKSLGYIAVVFLLYGMSAAIYRDSVLSAYFNSTVMMCLPAFVLAFCVNDWSVTMRVLGKAGPFIAASCIIPLNIVIKNSIRDESMGYSYVCAFFMLCMMYRFFNDKGLKNRIISAASCALIFITIVMMGSRGPLLGIASFVVFAVYFSHSDIRLKIAVSIPVIIFVFAYQQIFIKMYEFAGSHGYSSRTLYLLANDLEHDSGRGDIQQVFLNEIGKAPFEIRGIGYNIVAFQRYPHNIAIELIYQFGIVLGSVMLAFILWLFIKHLLWKTSDESETRIKQVGILLFCIGVLPMIVSHTLWQNMQFWVWLGYSLKWMDTHKGNKLLRSRK